MVKRWEDAFCFHRFALQTVSFRVANRFVSRSFKFKFSQARNGFQIRCKYDRRQQEDIFNGVRSSSNKSDNTLFGSLDRQG